MSNRLPVIADEIKRAHDDARTAARFSAERAMEAGRLLIEAKAALGHGEWLPWLRTNVLMSERTARGYMTLAKSGLKSATVADLGLRATLARMAKRKGPALNLRAGTSLWIQAGRHAGSSSLPFDPLPDHSLHLWSVDGQFAFKTQFSLDPVKRPDPWEFTWWRKPVKLDALRPYLIAEGFPLADAQVVHRYEADPDEIAEWKARADDTAEWIRKFTAIGAPGFQ